MQQRYCSGTDFGPPFQRITRDYRNTTGDRLSGKHMARLIKRTVMNVGIRADLPVPEGLKRCCHINLPRLWAL